MDWAKSSLKFCFMFQISMIPSDSKIQTVGVLLVIFFFFLDCCLPKTLCLCYFFAVIFSDHTCTQALTHTRVCTCTHMYACLHKCTHTHTHMDVCKKRPSGHAHTQPTLILTGLCSMGWSCSTDRFVLNGVVLLY